MIDQKQKAFGRAAGGNRTGMACAAAFAAALFVLAPSPAAAQECSGESINVCGFVWTDTNHDGIQDAGEIGIEGVKVTAFDGTNTFETYTDSNGFYYYFLEPGNYSIYVVTSSIFTAAEASPSNAGLDDSVDSDGRNDPFGNSFAQVTVVNSFEKFDFDFGFYAPQVVQQPPGTGTPGYWKNHPEAWPVTSIMVGGVSYTKEDAILWLGRVGKDKTTTMFSSLVPAILNVMIGNKGSCIAGTITLANAWMAAHPLGSKVAASSDAWGEGEPLHQQMDAYNNGLLCAKHRN